MPRPREFETDAERQRAYRDRNYWQQPPTQKFLAGGALGLHEEIRRAIQNGTCPFPAQVLGKHAGETLNNLQDYIEHGSWEAVEAARKARRVPPGETGEDSF